MTSRWLTGLILGATIACGGGREQAPATSQSAAPTATPPAAAAPPQPSPAKTPEPTPVVTPVDFERLSALLPAFPGWTRGLVRGENVSAGIEIAKAEAQYQMGESAIDLEIIDSAMSPVVLMPRTMFMGKGYSERFPEGYRKAVTIAGSPAFEAWDGDARRAEITTVVARRYVVQATGHNVDNLDAVRALVTSIDFAGLAAIK